MIYGDKLKENLKNENDPICKMYLNELLLAWRKVDSVYDIKYKKSLDSIVNAISEFTEQLYSNPKFHFTEKTNTGFTPDSDVFFPYYIYDILDKIFRELDVTDEISGLSLKKRFFHTGMQIQKKSLVNTIKKPDIKFTQSDSYYSLCLVFDLQYRMNSKKFFTKTKVYIPLIVFYVKKSFNLEDLNQILKIKQEVKGFNAKAKVMCISEYADKKYIEHFEDIKEDLYFVRTGFLGEYRDINVDVCKFIKSQIETYILDLEKNIDEIVPFGHIDLIKNNSEE